MLIRVIQRSQGHRDSLIHEFSSGVNKVNKAVAKVRTTGDRLPLTNSTSKQRLVDLIIRGLLQGTTKRGLRFSPSDSRKYR